MLDAIGQYKILELIGSSALGELYRGRDTRVGRTVSVIVVAAEIAGDRSRSEGLLADARAASRLSHPNIAAIYEVGVENDRLFLATEFIQGQTLAQLVATHPLNPRRAIDYATQVADGLAEAHSTGLAHGAITARTIVITAKDSAKILDFGLSGRTGDRSAPDEAGDVAALGLLLFQMLTAQVPQPGWPVPAPRSINRRVPLELDRVVARLLARTDEPRTSAAAVAARLRSVAATLDARQEAGEPPAPFDRRPGGSPMEPASTTGAWTTWVVVVAAVITLGALVWAAIVTSLG